MCVVQLNLLRCRLVWCQDQFFSQFSDQDFVSFSLALRTLFLLVHLAGPPLLDLHNSTTRLENKSDIEVFSNSERSSLCP
jgi:hypothetical protein